MGGRRFVKRTLVGTILGALLAASVATANSVASIVVSDNGDVCFSDYVRDKIWKISARGKLSVALSNT